MNNPAMFSLFGGVALLLYGLKLLGEALQIVGESRLRTLFNWVTSSRLKGLASGMLVALGIQSSNAVSVMLVGFAGSGLLNLNRVIPLVLGANIGSTLTVHLLAFHLLDYALPIIAVGFGISFVSRSKKGNAAGNTIVGFGLLFLGLKILTEGMAPVGESEIVKKMLLASGDGLFIWGVIASAILTAILHSSAATIAILIAMSNTGLVTIHMALPVIIGANIGTCTSAMISSIGEKVEARRVAMAHIFFKIGGSLLVLPFTGLLAEAIASTANSMPRQIANAHTLFNILLALIFLPFSKIISKTIKRLIPPKARSERVFAPKYLDRHALASPLLALGQATREVLRMGDIVQGMLFDVMKGFKENDLTLLEDVESRDDKVDLLDREIKLFITTIAQQELSEETSHNQISLLSVSNDLENIGDIIDKNIIELGKKKIYKNLRFSKEGWNDIIEMHKEVSDGFQLVINALATQNLVMAELVINDGKKKVRKMEEKFKQAHIMRLQAGQKQSIESSAIHMDLLTNLKRIHSHLIAIARSIRA